MEPTKEGQQWISQDADTNARQKPPTMRQLRYIDILARRTGAPVDRRSIKAIRQASRITTALKSAARVNTEGGDQFDRLSVSCAVGQ